jgi:hypothetical protein
MTKLLSVLVAAILCADGASAQELPARLEPLLDTFSEPVLVGMKLAFAKNYRQGRVGILQYQCIAHLRAPLLREPVYRLLASSLSEEELLDAQDFYASPVGQKYAKFGVLQIYSSVGEDKPEPDPKFTNHEERTLESFADRPAGRKLIREQILERPATRQALAPTVNSLVRNCMSAR